jgi:hypothetical protein
MYKNRYLFERTLGKYFKFMVYDLTTEGFFFSTPSIEMNYSKFYRSGGIILDLFFWSLMLGFYPDGDSADNLVSTPSKHDDDECDLCTQEEEVTLLDKSNVALRDVIG